MTNVKILHTKHITLKNDVAFLKIKLPVVVAVYYPAITVLANYTLMCKNNALL